MDLIQTCKNIHTLAIISFKSRNEGSILGIFWYLLNPILLFSLLLLIFMTRLGDDIPHYPLYLLVGIILFNFFRQVTLEATRILETQSYLIKSVSISLPLLVFVSTYKLLLSHMIEIGLLFVALIFFGINPMFVFLYVLILPFFILFIYGVSLFLVVINAYITDTEYIWIFFSQLLWFVTPIFYAIEGQQRLFLLNLFNPLFYFISLTRDMIIYNIMSPWWMFAGAFVWSVVVFGIGVILYLLFKKRIPEMV